MASKLDLSIFSNLVPKIYGSWEDEIRNNIRVQKDEYSIPYDITLTPYIRFIYENIDNKDVEILGLKIVNQSSKSLCAQTISIEWARRYGGLIAYHYPSKDKAKEEVLGKIIPMVNASPVYHDCLVRNTQGKAKQHSLTYDKLKFKNGGIIHFKGSNAATDFKSYSARLVILDEYAEINRNTGELGDNLVRAHGRTDSYAHTNRKVIALSTPKYQGEDIEKLWDESQQFQYHVGCRCGEHFYLDPLKIDFDKVYSDKNQIDLDSTKNEIELGNITPYISCPHCGEVYTESDKYELMAKGAVVQVGGYHRSPKRRSIHVSAMYSFKPWNQIAAAGIEAKQDPTRMINYKQEILAEGATPILANLNRFNVNSLPKGDWTKGLSKVGDRICTAIDVQQNSIYYLTIAKVQNKIHVLNYGHEYLGSSVFNYQGMLEEFSKFGDVLIDTGFKTQEISELLRDMPQIVPIRGIHHTSGKPIAEITFPENDYFRKKFCIYSTPSEDLTEQYIQNGTILFPSDVDEELAEHLSNIIISEKTTNTKWVKAISKSTCHVDLRDCLRYSLIWLVGGRNGFRWSGGMQTSPTQGIASRLPQNGLASRLGNGSGLLSRIR